MSESEIREACARLCSENADDGAQRQAAGALLAEYLIAQAHQAMALRSIAKSLESLAARHGAH